MGVGVGGYKGLGVLCSSRKQRTPAVSLDLIPVLFAVDNMILELHFRGFGSMKLQENVKFRYCLATKILLVSVEE